MNSKDAITAALTERAQRLWGQARAEKARVNIDEAAEYTWLIAEHPLTNDDAPLFHPPVGPPLSPSVSPPQDTQAGSH